MHIGILQNALSNPLYHLENIEFSHDFNNKGQKIQYFKQLRQVLELLIHNFTIRRRLRVLYIL